MSVRVVAINSSPRMGKGNTALVLDPFIEGMKDAGAKVELFYTKKLNIKPCIGDFRCWGSTPGKCRFRDDMDTLLPKLRDAEIWVLGIPLYVPMPGEIQNLINRTMPLLDGDIDVRKGRMYPKRRKEFNLRSLVLVSSCYFWGMDNFDKLTFVIEETALALGAEYAGALLRPQADVFKTMLEAGEGGEKAVSAARSAGVQLIRNGKMAKSTLKKVSENLLSSTEFLRRFSSNG